ncbi:MAG: hypothetical protein N3G20_08615, partial [Verrucomicrobiae bacterium]|nr:hypothetical protein [Verrucomicrobiae bacterium]
SKRLRMLQKGKLNQLEQLRRDLVLEADLRREALRLEAAELKRITDSQWTSFRTPLLKPAMMLLGLIVGAFGTRAKGKLATVAPVAVALFKFLRHRL